MTKKWEKYYKKSSYKNELKEIVGDIYHNKFDWYDISSIKWNKWHFRIRKWKIRVIFEKKSWKNIIKKIDTRWDVYKWI